MPIICIIRICINTLNIQGSVNIVSKSLQCEINNKNNSKEMQYHCSDIESFYYIPTFISCFMSFLVLFQMWVFLWKEFSRTIFSTVEEFLYFYVMQFIREVKGIKIFQFEEKMGPSFISEEYIILKISFFYILINWILYSWPFVSVGSAAMGSTTHRSILLAFVFWFVVWILKFYVFLEFTFCMHTYHKEKKGS